MTEEQPQFTQEFRDNLVSLLKWRRSVRRFRPDSVPDGLVEDLIDLMKFAPSVGNSQPWRVIRVLDLQQRAIVGASFDSANMSARERYNGDQQLAYDRLNLSGFKDAPVHLAIFTDMDPAAGHGQGRATMPETLVHSTVCAIYTLWLAARSYGLGLTWVTTFDPKEVERAFAVPTTWRFTAYICLGWPQQDQCVPEFESAGWQERLTARSSSDSILRRR